MISKIQNDRAKCKIDMFFYHKAREAMFDIVSNLKQKGYDNIFIPGYIGWSPKEGSGIFDPINSITGLRRHYYRMTADLEIDTNDLETKLLCKSILLIVNYFGFRDKNIKRIIENAKNKDCVVIEDNAHGFFTFFCNERAGSDFTFFSLHKMFPFEEGGSFITLNKKYDFCPERNLDEHSTFDPFIYDINTIARKRKENFKALIPLVQRFSDYFRPLRKIEDIENCVPQTFPIVIKRGNRNMIYEIMNEKGYGVVSLYHTLIEDLRKDEFKDALELSRRIMNLPVHQDCDPSEYPAMIDTLVKACTITEEKA